MNNEQNMPEVISGAIVNVQNTYSYINNTGFYALANRIYFNFFYRFARRYAWWYDGWVPDIHNADKGIFSTGLAHSLVDGIAGQIIGKKILLQPESTDADYKKTLKEAYKWADDIRLTQVLRTATKYAGALSTSLLKLNVSKKGLWLEALRMDNFFFETNFKGDIESAVCLINSYTNTENATTKQPNNFGEDCNHQETLQEKYYLVEKRYFKKKKEKYVRSDGKECYGVHKVPYVIYQVHNYRGNILNAQSWNLSLQEEVRWDSIPSSVRNSIKRDYGVIQIGVEQRLPFFEELGVELVRYNGDDGSLSQQPFGESILKNIQSDLIDYDFTFSWAFRDKYIGKGTVFLGKELQTITSGTTEYSGLDDFLITRVPTLDGKLPLEKVQFDLRVDEWTHAKDTILNTIAMKIGISPSTIASFLTDNTARTAKEVGTEEKDTDNYIDIQRGCLTPAFNKILKIVGEFYGWTSIVEVKFAKSGSSNMDTIIERNIKLVNAGLRSPKSALREIMADADEYEVDNEYAKILEYQQEQEQKERDKQESLFGSFDKGQTSFSE